MRPYYIFIIITWCFVGCKLDSKRDKTGNGGSKEALSQAYILNNQKDIFPLEIESMRKVATEALTLRKKESGNKSYTALDKDIWHFGGLISETKTLFGDSLNGTWLDFKENLTYDYGQYDEKVGSGHYFYDLEKATLLMLDDNLAIKPQEFEVKMNGDMLVIVGQPIYKDNNMQSKLDRSSTFPSKKPANVPVQ